MAGIFNELFHHFWERVISPNRRGRTRWIFQVLERSGIPYDFWYGERLREEVLSELVGAFVSRILNQATNLRRGIPHVIDINEESFTETSDRVDHGASRITGPRPINRETRLTALWILFNGSINPGDSVYGGNGVTTLEALENWYKDKSNRKNGE